jgi:hypothetical protein
VGLEETERRRSAGGDVAVVRQGRALPFFTIKDRCSAVYIKDSFMTTSI